MADRLFRQTKDSRWEVMRDTLPGNNEAYAWHRRCGGSVGAKWSWLLDDYDPEDDGKAKCYGCGTEVPAYIQAIIRLYEGK